MSRVFIKGTRRFSQGRRDLSRAAGIMQIRRNPENSSYVARDTDVLVNWGQTGENYGNVPEWINHPSNVQFATDKIASFNRWNEAGVPTVEHTHDRSRALDWLYEDGTVMHRALARGSQGRGISVADSEPELPGGGGFYCRIFGDDSNREYRIHVVDGKIIDTTQKRRRSRENGYEGRFDSTVRSSSNGWVFCRSGVECPAALNDAAIQAVQALGLDFGAVDCAVSEAGEICIYEVNTAPGLEGTTLERYAGAIGTAVQCRSRGA